MVSFSRQKITLYALLVLILLTLLSATPSAYDRVLRARRARELLRTSFSEEEASVLRTASFQFPEPVENGSSSTASGRATVMLMPLTHHVANMYHNARCHQTRHMPRTSIVPVSLDGSMSAALRSSSTPFVELPEVMAGGARNTPEGGRRLHVFRTPGFIASTIGKLLSVRNALTLGLDVLLLDTDVILCRDPLPELRRQLGALGLRFAPDILVQHNEWPRDSKKVRCGNFNTGFYLVRAHARTVRLFEDMVRASTWPGWEGKDDQDIFQAFVCKRSRKGETRFSGKCQRKMQDPDVMMCRSQDGVTAQSLPIPTFPNGSVKPVGPGLNQTLSEACSAKSIFLVHVNYRKGPQKPRYLRQNKLWALEKDEKSCVPLR